MNIHCSQLSSWKGRVNHVPKLQAQGGHCNLVWYYNCISVLVQMGEEELDDHIFVIYQWILMLGEGVEVLELGLDARNQTFCSKSVNKAPKVQIFGLNTLCSILSNCTWKKFRYQNQFLMYFIVLWISYVFLCFFDLLFLLFFSPKFVADTFWSTINQKLINFSNWE